MISFTSPCNSEGSDGDAEKKKNNQADREYFHFPAKLDHVIIFNRQ